MANTDKERYFDKEATAGRPIYVLNEFGLTTVEKLASVFCTDEEMASFMGTSIDTLLNARNKVAFTEYKKRGMDTGKATLRRKQFELAMKGNCTMLIWLGRNYLNQSEKIEEDDTGVKNALNKVAEAIEKVRKG